MYKIKKKQKQDMTMLYEFILLVAVIVIVSLLVFSISEDAREDIFDAQIETATCNASSGIYTGCGTAYNATIDVDTAVAKIPKSLKLLGTAVVFGAVLWVILRVIPMGRSSTTFQ
jgi:hypothetical protein